MVTLRPSTPWYNDEIASAKRERRKLERHWRKTKLTVHQQLYKDKCKQVRSLITSAKMEFYSDLVKENKGNHKVLFSAIDRMLNLTPEKCYPSRESAKELCNNFSDFSQARLPQFDRIQTLWHCLISLSDFPVLIIPLFNVSLTSSSRLLLLN